MDNYFCFAGRRCTDFDVFVERFPVQEKPMRQVELISVPGRNGALRMNATAVEGLQKFQKYPAGCIPAALDMRSSVIHTILEASG